MGMILKAKENPVITSVAAGAVTLTSIIGGFSALGVDPIPWVSAAEIAQIEKDSLKRDEELTKVLQSLVGEQKQMRKDQDSLMRDFWQKKLEEAQEELNANPHSRTARAQKLEAERAIAEIDRRAAGSPHP